MIVVACKPRRSEPLFPDASPHLVMPDVTIFSHISTKLLFPTAAVLIFAAGYAVGERRIYARITDGIDFGAVRSHGKKYSKKAFDGHSASAKAASEVVFLGMCDASGAVPIDVHRFAVADDETNLIRIYDADQGGLPVRILHAEPRIPASQEADLEAATRLGDQAFWLGSHGRNKKGRVRPERLTLFSTSMPGLKNDLRVVGDPYTHLLQDIEEEPSFRRFGILGAADLAPQTDGALNLEGLTAMPSGGGLLGFRNPIIEGKALLVEIVNLARLPLGERADFGAPILLPLGGLGVRGISWWRGDYLIVAGPVGEGTSKLFRWRGVGSEPVELNEDFLAYNPEGFFSPEERDEVLLLSDDGGVEIGGKRCKSLRDPTQKRFRGVWIELNR